jgi:glutathione S-transferase
MAPNPRIVRIFLAEKGIEVPIVPVDLAAGEHKTPEFLAKNPSGTVPVLELDDGSCLSETVAICLYFEKLYPKPPLFGNSHDAKEQAFVEMWRRRIELEIVLPLMHAIRNTHPGFAHRVKQQFPDYGNFCRQAVLERLDWLDGVLQQTPFIAGNIYSIADITLVPWVDFSKVIHLEPFDRRAQLRGWYENVSKRGSSKA